MDLVNAQCAKVLVGEADVTTAHDGDNPTAVSRVGIRGTVYRIRAEPA